MLRTLEKVCRQIAFLPYTQGLHPACFPSDWTGYDGRLPRLPQILDDIPSGKTSVKIKHASLYFQPSQTSQQKLQDRFVIISRGHKLDAKRKTQTPNYH